MPDDPSDKPLPAQSAGTKDEEVPRQKNGPSDFDVLVSKRFLFQSLLCCVLVAFAVGRTARMIFLVHPQQRLFDSQQHLLLEQSSTRGRGGGETVKLDLPDPVLKIGKVAPPTQYTSKTFDTTRSSSTQSRWVVTAAGRQQQCVNQPDRECNATESASTYATTSREHEGAAAEQTPGESHLPAGQHLLMDIQYVNEAFLNSEERLAHAMLDLVEVCGLTLLSYHCHKLFPTGVSCAGVLLESHVSFHTWPKEGVITLDLYTCGPNSLIPIVPLAEKLFAIPRDPTPNEGDEVAQPRTVWSHKLRGFYDDESEFGDAFHNDMTIYPLGIMTNYKKEIVSIATKFQHVDVYHVIHHDQRRACYLKSLRNDGSYESLNAKMFEPDCLVFLDGILQSCSSGDAEYHEALVHPSMFAHNAPKRVAIVGGGEGATLREVLKHKTVEKVVMIEIDEMMVNISRQYLPSWSDCSNIVGAALSCFDDARVEMRYEDAFKFLIDNFSSDNQSGVEPFDVIIMDALDPQVRKDFVDHLYADGPFLRSLPNALTKEGIFVGQIGKSPKLEDPADEISYVGHNRANFVESLTKVGFDSVTTYLDGGNNCFDSPWMYLVAFKDFESRKNWFSSSTVVDTKIRHRSFSTIDGDSPFLTFDGPTMLTYQFPSKPIEVVFCRGHPHIKECREGHGFDPERLNVPLSSLEVKQSSLGERVGRGVFATIDIPQQSYVGLEKLIPIVYGNPQTYDLMGMWEFHNETIYNYYRGEHLEVYTHGYGHIFSYHGGNDVFVDSTFHCFINHACGAQNNVGHNLTLSEATADPDNISPEILDSYLGSQAIYNPAKERQVHFYSSAIPLRDIEKGEELFDNYIPMCGKSSPYWNEHITGLKAQCEGTEVGIIKEYDVWKEKNSRS